MILVLREIIYFASVQIIWSFMIQNLFSKLVRWHFIWNILCLVQICFKILFYFERKMWSVGFCWSKFFVRKDLGKYFCLMCSCASRDICPVLFANTQFLWQIITCEYTWFTWLQAQIWLESLLLLITSRDFEIWVALKNEWPVFINI